MNTLEKIIEELKPHLVEYLDKHNIRFENKDKILCINKEHNDQHPTMSIVPASNGTILHCFSCLASYDIIGAANQIEQLPNKGSEFITKTIPNLCQQVNIAYDPASLQLTPEQLEMMRYRTLYEDAAITLREIGIIAQRSKTNLKN